MKSIKDDSNFYKLELYMPKYKLLMLIFESAIIF
jgi:hypothetical protein